METTTDQKPVLQVADRCDYCGSQAFVLVKFVTGELMFCGHHFEANEGRLRATAFSVTDERGRIPK